MKREEIINEFWSNALICIILYISSTATYASCEKSNNYEALLLNGCVYTAPCIGENIRFLFIRELVYPKWFLWIMHFILASSIVYLFVDIYAIFSGISRVYVWMTLICSSLYPARSFIFTVYFFFCYSNGRRSL